MKRIIFALCLLIAVTSCVSKKKYMVAENGRLAALSRERVLNRNLGQQKDEIAKLKQQITDLMSDTTRLGQAIRDYRKSLYSNLSEQEKLNMLLKEKMEKLAEREATINKLQAEVDAQNARLQSLLNSVKDALLGFSSDELTVTEKNGKIYAPYILSVIAAVAMFYIIQSLALNPGFVNMLGFNTMNSILTFA